MGIRGFIKNTAKNNVNVKGWISWDSIKNNGKTVASLVSNLKVPDGKPTEVRSTFEALVKRDGLSEQDLQARRKSHIYVALGCVFLGLIGFVWTILLFMKLMFLSALVALSLTSLMFAYAFREHFYSFQIKKRSLDCTFKEWFSGFFSNKK